MQAIFPSCRRSDAATSLPRLSAGREVLRDEPRDGWHSRPHAGEHNTMYVHPTLVPFIAAAGELKTKPTQHSVMKLREIGIQPDILLCRTDQFLSPEIKAKIALFCNVEKD